MKTSLTGKKLKLLADAQFPENVLDEFQVGGVKVEKIDQKYRGREDKEILKIAESKGKILLTMDKDFWDDKKFPLHTLKNGIIYIAESPDNHDSIIRAFCLLYGGLAKYFPGEWWSRMKIRASASEFYIKMHTWEGKTSNYKVKLQNGRLAAD